MSLLAGVVLRLSADVTREWYTMDTYILAVYLGVHGYIPFRLLVLTMLCNRALSRAQLTPAIIVFLAKMI